MTKPFTMTRAMRIGTIALKTMLHTGIPLGTLRLLEHQGRKSGKTYITPVALVKNDRQSWLVAAFGEVNWVHNIRAARKARLKTGRRTALFNITELAPQEAAPILQQFLRQYRMVPFFRPYFHATATSPLTAFKQDALEHPVFLLNRTSL